MHHHIHKYTNLELIEWIQSLSVGFTPKEQTRPKIGMRNVPHLDLCGENPSHLLLGRFHDNAWVQLFKACPLVPQSLKAWTPTQRTLLWALCHFPTAKLLLSHIYPHSSSFRQIIIFSLKQCLVLVTTTLKWNLWRYCLIKNVTEHQVSLLLWIQRPLPPHPNIQKESAVPTFKS